MKAWIELDGWIFTCPESWNTLKYDFAIMYSGQVFLLLTSTPSLQQTFHIYYCSMKSCFIFMTRLALNMHRSVWRHFIFFLSTLQCQRTGLCADGWQCPELRGAWYHLLFFFFFWAWEVNWDNWFISPCPLTCDLMWIWKMKYKAGKLPVLWFPQGQLSVHS